MVMPIPELAKFKSTTASTTITYRRELGLLFLRYRAFVRHEVEERNDWAFRSFPHFRLLLCRFGLGHLALEALAAEAGATRCRTHDERSALATPARLALATTGLPHVACLRTTAAAGASRPAVGASRPAVGASRPAAGASRPADITKRHSQHKLDETLVEEVM